MGAGAALWARRSVCSTSLVWAALARPLALSAALGAAAALPLREAADCEAPERAALALAAVLAAARVLAAPPVLVPALLAVVLAAVALALAAVLPATLLAEAGAFGAAALAAEVFEGAEAFEETDALEETGALEETAVLPALLAAVLLVLAAVLLVLPAALALAGFFVEGSAATAEVRAVLLPAPRRAPATDALRFFAVFLLEDGIRGYSFCCPAVETGREAS